MHEDVSVPSAPPRESIPLYDLKHNGGFTGGGALEQARFTKPSDDSHHLVQPVDKLPHIIFSFALLLYLYFFVFSFELFV
jgi:hypothetical protein